MDNRVLKVDSSLFADSADRMYYELKSVYGCFQNLNDIVMDEKRWIGSGADSCRAAFQRKNDMVDEIKRRFQCDINDLKQIAGIYVQTEEITMETVDSLPSDFLV